MSTDRVSADDASADLASTDLASTDLAERYGRGPAATLRRRVIGIAALVFALTVTVAWVIWAGPLQPAGTLESRDLGFVIRDDESVEVRFEVTTAPGTPVTCALQSLDEQFGIVGWKIVELPPSDRRTRTFSETLVTTHTPVTGTIYRCWPS